MITTTLRSVLFSLLALVAIVGAVPAIASAQSVSCGWYGTSPQYCGTGTLLVYLQVLNQGSAPYSSSNFTVNVTGQNALPSSFSGSLSGTIVSLTGGSSYAVNVPDSYGYQPSYSAGCNGTIATGQQSTCVITMNASNQYYSNPVPYPYPYSYPSLSCSPQYQTVPAGQITTFTAVGGSSSTYDWTTPTQNYLDVGSVLNTALQTTGTEVVTVTNNSQSATCTVNVVANGPILYPGSTNSFIPPVPPILQQEPSLPNTGFAPVSTLGIVLGILTLLGISALVLPYVKKAFVIITR